MSTILCILLTVCMIFNAFNVFPTRTALPVWGILKAVPHVSEDVHLCAGFARLDHTRNQIINLIIKTIINAVKVNQV